jgi:hypothetical protein
MLSPLPRNKRAKNPSGKESTSTEEDDGDEGGSPVENGHKPKNPPSGAAKEIPTNAELETKAE